MHRIAAFTLLTFLLCAALSSCTGSASPARLSPGEAAPAHSADPAAEIPPRSINWSAGFLPPSMYDKQDLPENRISEESGRDSIDFMPYRFEPTGSFNEHAYCMFRTEVEGPSLSITTDWASAPPPDTAFLGLGNRALLRWQWFPLPTGEDALEIADSEPYTDGNGEMLLALVLIPGVDMPTSVLNTLRVDASPQASGWNFVVAGEQQVADGTFVNSLALQTHAGKPVMSARLYDQGSEATSTICCFADNAAAAEETAWQTTSLLATAGLHSSSLLSIGDQLCFAAFIDGSSEFLFGQSSAPDTAFTEQRQSVSFDPMPSSVFLGEVDDSPVISFKVPIDAQSPDPPDEFEYAGFGYPTDTDWTLLIAHNMGYQGNLGELARPLELDGRALLVFEDGIDPDPNGVYYAHAASTAPLSEADFAVGLIGEAKLDSFRLGLDVAMLNGQPCVLSTFTQFTDTPYLRFFSLSGTDPAAENWDVHTMDYFDFTNIDNHAFAVVNEKPAVLNINRIYEGSLLNYVLDLQQSSTAMPAGIESWGGSVPSPDAGSARIRLAGINGGPALAIVQEINLADGLKYLKLIYGYYTP